MKTTHEYTQNCTYCQYFFIILSYPLLSIFHLFSLQHLQMPKFHKLGFLSGSKVKNSPAMQEPQKTKVQSLGWEDPLEEGKATHSSILAWRIPMDGEAWQATVHGVAKSQTRLK